MWAMLQTMALGTSWSFDRWSFLMLPKISGPFKVESPSGHFTVNWATEDPRLLLDHQPGTQRVDPYPKAESNLLPK